MLNMILLSACGEATNESLLEKKYTNKASRFVLVDGNRVHYRDEGEGQTIVLIHGTASSLHTWDKWNELLKHDYRVIRMDLPGFGLTGPDHNRRYEVQDDIRFLSAFLAHVNTETIHLVGSSLGGRIAWQYALEFPDKVESLTLMNALGYEQESWPPPIELAQWPIVDKIMEIFSPRFMYQIGLKDVYFDERLVTDELVDRYFELSRYRGNLAEFPSRVKARLDKDSALISGISVPTLIQWGRDDKYFPVENAYRFDMDIRKSNLRIYSNVGHLPMEELPESTVRDFKEFIRNQ